MFLYWPVVLIGITVSVICFPSRGLYHRTRLWMLYTDVSLMLREIAAIVYFGSEAYFLPVASVTFWILSSRIPGFLHGRYVLLSYIPFRKHRTLLLPLCQQLDEYGAVCFLKLSTFGFFLLSSWNLACAAVFKTLLRYP